MRGKTPIDEYLARVGDEQRAALERLRLKLFKARIAENARRGRR